MIKKKSLVNGIGDLLKTKKFYNDWAIDYDKTLEYWNYKVPQKSAFLLSNILEKNPKNILDLACGTGLFGSELKKIYKNSNIYGSDISSKSLLIAKEKKIYKHLNLSNFETIQNYDIKFELISMIGAMTYCKNLDKLINNVIFYMKNKGYFIFSHRIDLWKKQKFNKRLESYKKYLKVKFISRPMSYLPKNRDFGEKIKIRLVLLQKH